MEEYDATQIENKEAGGLKKGDYVMMKDKPCKITGISHAKPGKHGSAKAIIQGNNLFDGKTVEQSFSTGDMVACPIVTRKEYLCLGVDDDHLSLLDDDGEQKDDVQMPDKMHEEVGKQIQEMLDDDKQVLVTVTTVLGTDMVTACREEKE